MIKRSVIIIGLIGLACSSIITIKGKADVSEDTKKLQFSHRQKDAGSEYKMKTPSQEMGVDTGFSFQLSPNYFNGDLAVGPERLIGIVNYKEILPHNSYDIQYQIPSDIYLSKRIKENAILANDKLINCNYTLNNPSINHTQSVPFVLKDIKNKKLLSHFGLLIVLENDELIILDKQRNIRLSQLESGSSYLSYEQIKDFWVIEKGLDYGLLVVVTKGNPFTIYVYNINSTKKTGAVTFDYSIKKETLNKNDMDMMINTVGYYDDTLVFGTTKGIIFATITDKTPMKIEVVNLTSKENIIDLRVLPETVYAISKGKGLYIYEKNDPELEIVFIKHSHMKQIDYIQNPFTGYQYVGIFLEIIPSYNDFFIEFNVDDEKHPEINKIFTVSFNQIQSYTTPDPFFSYFINPTDNTLIVIRRGLLDFINALSYCIPLPDTTDYSSIINYYDSFTNINSPAFINSSNHTIQSFEFLIPNHQLACTINQVGKYRIVFKRPTDACSVNMDISKSICTKVNHYKITVHNKDEISFAKKMYCLSALILLMVLFFILFIGCAKYTKCFKKNNLKVYELDKTKLVRLYDDDVNLSELSIIPDIQIELKTIDLLNAKTPHDQLETQEQRLETYKQTQENVDYQTLQGL